MLLLAQPPLQSLQHTATITISTITTATITTATITTASLTTASITTATGTTPLATWSMSGGAFPHGGWGGEESGERGRQGGGGFGEGVAYVPLQQHLISLLRHLPRSPRHRLHRSSLFSRSPLLRPFSFFFFFFPFFLLFLLIHFFFSFFFLSFLFFLPSSSFCFILLSYNTIQYKHEYYYSGINSVEFRGHIFLPIFVPSTSYPFFFIFPSFLLYIIYIYIYIIFFIKASLQPTGGQIRWLEDTRFVWRHLRRSVRLREDIVD